MILIKLHIFTALILIGLVLFIGCSPTSNTSRYKPKTEKSSKKDPSVRFTSDESKPKSIKVNQKTDTTGFDIYSSEDEDEGLPEEEPYVDISPVLNKYGNNDLTTGKSTVKEKMLMEIIKYINTPYKYGGNSKLGIDCSAFTQTVYNALSVSLLRSARQQYSQGLPVQNRINLQFGDLVFFDTRRSVRPGHVGIYLGGNLFAHASSKKGVIVSSMDHEYYSRKFMGGRRIEGFLSSN